MPTPAPSAEFAPTYAPTGAGAKLPGEFKVNAVGYSQMQATEFYPWQYIVEPHRTTYIEMKGCVAKNTGGIFWEITYKPDADPSLDAQVLLPRRPGGCDLHVNFTKVSQIYDVAVEVHGMDGDGGAHASATYRAPMMCKYVRREIRDLTDADRRKYLEGMEQISMLPLADGQALYGNKFMNLESFAVKHIHTQECSPFHGGLSFITAHAAFTLELEQALQAIDPSITQPYWDYTLDYFMLGHEWDQSIVFDRDWFGSADSGVTSTDEHIVASSYFDHVPVPTTSRGRCTTRGAA